VTSYLTEKLSKLRSFDRQQRRLQNGPFQSSFTHRTAQFTQAISQFAHFTLPTPRWHHLKALNLPKMNERETTLGFVETYRSLPERTRRHTGLTKKLTNLTGKLCCARKYSVHSILLPTLCTYLIKNYHNSHLKPHTLKVSVMHN